MASNNSAYQNQNNVAPAPQPGGNSPRMNKGGKTGRNGASNLANMSMNPAAAKSTRYGKFQLQ